MPGEWSVVFESPAPTGWNVVREDPAEKPNPVMDQVEGVGRSLKNQAKGLFDTLHALVDPVAAEKMGSGLVDAQVSQWQKAKEEYKAGNYANAARRGLAAAVPLLGPLIENTAEKVTSGKPGAIAEGITDVAAMPLLAHGVEALPEGTIPKAITGTVEAGKTGGAALSAAARAGGRDVAVGAAKVGGGVALPYAASMLPGPLGKLVEAPAIAGGVTAIKGFSQMGRGMAAGYRALRESIAESKAPAITDRTPIWEQQNIKPADIPEGPTDPTVAPQPRPITAPQDIQPLQREPIWKGLPSPSQEKFGPQETPVRPQLPSGRRPGGPATDTTTGAVVTKQTPGDLSAAEFSSQPEAQRTQFEGAYPIPAEERTVETIRNPPKEAYQRAARTVKARALARYLRIGGIPLEDAQSMSAEQWGIAAEGAGVNVPSPDSVKLALSELEKLYTAKGAVKIDEAFRKGNLAEARFYMDKAVKADASREGTLQ